MKLTLPSTTIGPVGVDEAVVLVEVLLGVLVVEFDEPGGVDTEAEALVEDVLVGVMAVEEFVEKADVVTDVPPDTVDELDLMLELFVEVLVDRVAEPVPRMILVLDVMSDVLEVAAVLETNPVLFAMIKVFEADTEVDVKRLVELFAATAEVDRGVLVVVVVLVELLSTF